MPVVFNWKIEISLFPNKWSVQKVHEARRNGTTLVIVSQTGASTYWKLPKMYLFRDISVYVFFMWFEIKLRTFLRISLDLITMASTKTKRPRRRYSNGNGFIFKENALIWVSQRTSPIFPAFLQFHSYMNECAIYDTRSPSNACFISIFTILSSKDSVGTKISVLIN